MMSFPSTRYPTTVSPTLAGLSEPTSRQTLWHWPPTTIRLIFVRSHLYLDFTTATEGVIEIYITPRRCGLAVDGDALDVGCDTFGNRVCDGLGVIVLDGDGCTCVEVAVVDGIFGHERRDDEVVCR